MRGIVVSAACRVAKRKKKRARKNEKAIYDDKLLTVLKQEEGKRHVAQNE